jgi:RNA polymerase sigma-70 factor, ECF subfamily
MTENETNKPRGPCRPGDPDEEAVAQVVSGHAAWAGIEAKYRGPLLRYGDKRLGERVHSEEAAQASFNSAFQNLPQFRGESSFLSWLWTICRNEVIRRRKKLDASSAVEGPIPEPVEGEEPGMLAGKVSLEQKHDQRREFVAVVNDIENNLPEQQSRVCNALLLVGLKESEAAEVLSMSVDAVRMNLMRGKNTLRELELRRRTKN